MSKPFVFAYQVEKLHPYKCDGDPETQCFCALQKAIASQPAKIFNLVDDEAFYYTEPKTGQEFKIQLQQ